MSRLALLGGDPVRREPFPAYNFVGREEIAAVTRVLESGNLSQYLGTWHDDFYGGPEVRAFESEWARVFKAKHAVSVNSATSGLYAAAGAAGVGPGDEVIVSPYTMMASATAAVIFNAVPVFADVDAETFCLTADSIRARLTPRTKAIIVVHIFGGPADMDPIMVLARERGLIVIEDCAQIPFGAYQGRPLGTLGHMGVHSLNYHKHIHTGEGGVVVTNDDRLAERLALIRNPGEAVVGKKGYEDIINIVGFNFRLGEMEAAVGRCQLVKGPDLVARRRALVALLEKKIAGIPGLRPAPVRPGDTHVYYVHPLLFDAGSAGVSRDLFVRAVKAELPPTRLREQHGVLIGAGYLRPLYLEPMYQKKIAYGTVNCPFQCPHYKGEADYRPGLCPNAERAHTETLITHELMRPPMTERDLDDVAAAFHKVAGSIPALRDFAAKSGT
ncbi:MAG: DegT/DnrJ/EryC1/StrS family aminotransferase [Pseudomonadota bacterium]